MLNPDGFQYHLTDLPFQRKDLNANITLLSFLNLSRFFLTPAMLLSLIHLNHLRLVNIIFTAQAVAIGSAADELVALTQSFIILTDSLSALTAIQSVNIKSLGVFLWLTNKIHLSTLLLYGHPP